MNINIFLYLQDKKIKKIPLEYKLLNNIPLTQEDLFVNGDLLLFRTNLTSLPNNLTVNGHLDLLSSKIEKLPNNLIVNRHLNIQLTYITELPDDLCVSGSLFCYNTPLANNIRNDESLLNKYSKQVKGRIII